MSEQLPNFIHDFHHGVNGELVRHDYWLLQKLSANLGQTREVYEKVLSETEDFMQVLHSSERCQGDYETAMR